MFLFDRPRSKSRVKNIFTRRAGSSTVDASEIDLTTKTFQNHMIIGDKMIAWGRDYSYGVFGAPDGISAHAISMGVTFSSNPTVTITRTHPLAYQNDHGLLHLMDKTNSSFRVNVLGHYVIVDWMAIGDV